MTSHLRLSSVSLVFVIATIGVSYGDLVDLSSVATDFQPMIVRGDPNGSPSDPVGNRIDPNVPSSQFAGVGSVTVVVPNVGTFGGTGTAISPYHVLTAGHLLDLDDNGSIDSNLGTVTFHLNINSGGANPSHSITASSLAIHPDFGGFNSPAGVFNDDLAIITLSSPLPAGVPIYPLLQTPITNITTLTLVGYGETGDGINGYTANSFSLNTKRVGFNDVDLAKEDDDAAPGNGILEVFATDFDGDNSSTNMAGGLTLGNDIETTLGPGDSGGPAFVDDNGILKLAGMNTFTFRFDVNPSDQIVTPGPAAPLFGSGAGGVLLNPYLSWINATVAIPEVSSLLLVGAVALLTGAVQSPRRRRVS